MLGRVVMIQGTSSSAGKSLLVAALCRILARRGYRVAPFKAQNMSNNAAICADGSEIGRSQALQAAAAGQAPTADMNPILLKPEADVRSQVIVGGRRWKTLSARDYFARKTELWPHVTAALDRLRAENDVVVIEGAGSPAELNLRDVEIVNMAVARYARAPVLLVGDIERGGVFAQLLGTLWLLNDEERCLVRGLIVNKFRGDVTLFDNGRVQLEQRGDVPVLGVVPWIKDLNLPEEDAEPLSRIETPVRSKKEVEIAVIRFPHISNFDDFAPLSSENDVQLRYVTTVSLLGRPAAVILPGTKSTMADLEWLRRQGFVQAIEGLAKLGTHVVGICGGYQMLGRELHDPNLVEGFAKYLDGLGLLNSETTFAGTKLTQQASGVIRDDRMCPGALGERIAGYEIHMGRSTSDSGWLQLQPAATQQSTNTSSQASVAIPPSLTNLDGCTTVDGRIWGCYVHGLFDNDSFRTKWLSFVRSSFEPNGVSMSSSDSAPAKALSYREQLEENLDRLADRVEQSLDMTYLEEIIRSSTEPQHVQ